MENWLSPIFMIFHIILFWLWFLTIIAWNKYLEKSKIWVVLCQFKKKIFVLCQLDGFSSLLGSCKSPVWNWIYLLRVRLNITSRRDVNFRWFERRLFWIKFWTWMNLSSSGHFWPRTRQAVSVQFQTDDLFKKKCSGIVYSGDRTLKPSTLEAFIKDMFYSEVRKWNCFFL